MAPTSPTVKSTSVKMGSIRLDVGSDAQGHGGRKVDLDVREVLERFGKADVALSDDELALALDPQPLLLEIFKFLQVHVLTEEFRKLQPLSISTKEKGWTHPFSMEHATTALGPNGAGKYMGSVTLSNFFDIHCTAEHEMCNWSSIQGLCDVLFPSFEPRDISTIIHTVLKPGFDVDCATSKGQEFLPPGTLRMVSHSAIMHSLLLAMAMDFANQPTAKDAQRRWWPVCRSLVVVVHANASPKNIVMLASTQNHEVQALGKHLAHSVLETADMVHSVRGELHAATGRPPTMAQLAAEFKDIPCVDNKEKLSSDRVLRLFVKVGEAFSKDKQCRRICSNIIRKHGRACIFDSAYKCDAILNCLGSDAGQYLPEVLHAIDYLLTKGAVAGPEKLSAPLLQGRATASHKEMGLVSLMLARAKAAEYVHSKAGSHVLADLVAIYITAATHSKFVWSQTTSSPAWMSNLSGINKAYKDCMSTIREGGADPDLRDAWKSKTTVDFAVLLQGSDGLTSLLAPLESSLNQLRLAQGAGPSVLVAPHPVDPQSTAAGAAQAGPSDVAADPDADTQAELRQKVMKIINERVSFLHVPLTADKADVSTAIADDLLYKSFMPAFKSTHRVWWLDIAHAPELTQAHLCPPSLKRSCGAPVKARLFACLELMKDGDLLFIFDGHYASNRTTVLEYIAEAESNIAKSKKFHKREFMMVYQEKEVNRFRSRGMGSAKNTEQLLIVSTVDLYLCKKRKRAGEDTTTTANLCYTGWTLPRPCDLPQLTLVEKKAIWADAKVAVGSATTEEGTRMFERLPRSMRGILPMSFHSRMPQNLTNLLVDFCGNQVIDLFPSHGVLIEAVFGAPKGQANITSVVLTNNAEHELFIKQHLTCSIMCMLTDSKMSIYDEHAITDIHRLFPALFVKKASLADESDADMMDGDSEDSS